MRKTAIIAFIAPMLVAAALLGGALLSAGTASAQTTTTDYDNDNDGLIDVRTLAQLNAIRYDLDGNGDAAHADYIAAFPNRDTSASGRMGCRQGTCTGYELRANLDFDTDDGSTYTSGAGWTPLGGHTNSATAFSATFEGNDYTVSNLSIHLSTTGDSEGNYVGLFGDLAATATIRNVGLVDPTVSNVRGGAGYGRTGALAGRSNGGTVSGSYVSGGSVTGSQSAVTGRGVVFPMTGCLLGYNRGTVSDSYATCTATTINAADSVDVTGGLVGENVGTVRDSYATGTVAGDLQAGGLVGFLSGGTALVTGSYATGAVSITGHSGNAGGLVGLNNAGADVIGSYATGAVSASGASSYAGGLVGFCSSLGAQVRASYATGAVSTSGDSGNAGGLVGGIWHGPSIVASYATGAVSASGGGANRLGGLVALISGAGSSVTNSYWDTETSGQTASVAGVGKTTSELQSPNGYTGIYANWNLNLDGQTGDDNPWHFGAANQYPVLRYGGHNYRAQLGDYDWDGDGLIEVNNLAKLNAIRWDLDGDGSVSSSDKSKYDAAFAGAVAGMGCRPYCTGYELTRDLDFDENNDGSITSADDDYWNGGKGWKPIGGSTNSFTATFDGNDKTISNLFIKDTTNGIILGLFGYVGTGGRVERLGVRDVNLTGSWGTGGLVGSNSGTINASYATGSVTATYPVGGLVGFNNATGTISASYATASVTGLGNTGGLVGSNNGTINASYATGSVVTTDVNHGIAGGLVGQNDYGTINASYATGSVTGPGPSDYGAAGGLVGQNYYGTISASYATGSVTGTGHSGGLVGYNYHGTISASYATGSVTGTGSLGGLVGYNNGDIIISASYWDTGTTGQAASAGVTGKTTRDLQSPAGYSGIYAAWKVDVDNADGDNNITTGVDDLWDFGTSRQYPVLKYGSLDPSKQRQTAIQSDNWNAPVVGEPVKASLNVTGATGITWQWQSSTNGSTWTDIASATSAAYIPVAADAASGGKFLRAKVSFTASGSSRTLTTVNTAKVVAATTATAVAGAVAFVPDVTVGAELEYAVSGAGATDHSWRWRRCANKEMTSGCAYVGDGAAAYRIVASDVGKYLSAYVYFADGSAWKRTTTPVLGPVVAAPPAASP